MGRTVKKRRSSRLDIIERKCDRILSELLVMRHHACRCHGDVDLAIDRLHRAAVRMRTQCRLESRIARRKYNAQSRE